MTPGGQKLGSASSAWQHMTPAQVTRPMLQRPAHARAALSAMPCLRVASSSSVSVLYFACQCLQRFMQLSLVRLQQHLLPRCQ